MEWTVEQGDCLEWLAKQPADGCSLVFGSPPYRLARTYGIDFNLADQAWVDWMVRVFQASLRVCNGLVAFVLEGQTENYRWTAEPALLMADLHRAGVQLRKPPVYRRCGVPGSGGPDWLRNDYEFIVCATRGGKLPWSDNTAMGHPPKWAPGGEMSNRLSDGTRVNEWGATGKRSGGRVRRRDGERPEPGTPDGEFVRAGGEPTGPTLLGDAAAETVAPPAVSKWGGSGRRTDRLPDGRRIKQNGKTEMGHTKHKPNGDMERQGYDPPAVANPGNVVQRTYTAEEVAALLGQTTDVVDCVVGGGRMGSPLASENEAPFPESLAEFFVRSFCPEGGLTIDPFSGSGTTGAVCRRWGRAFRGCDIRESQVALSRRRMEEERTLFETMDI